jgi:hypothetical protein
VKALLICNLIIALLQKCYAQLPDVGKLLNGYRIYTLTCWELTSTGLGMVWHWIHRFFAMCCKNVIESITCQPRTTEYIIFYHENLAVNKIFQFSIVKTQLLLTEDNGMLSHLVQCLLSTEFLISLNMLWFLWNSVRKIEN